MKRFLSILLVLVLAISLISFSACSDEDSQASPGQDAEQSAGPGNAETAQPTLPGETPEVRTEGLTDEETLAAAQQELRDRIAGGEEISIGIIPPTLAAQRLAGICQYIADYFTEMGGSAQISPAERKEENFITLIENFVTMGTDVIFVIPMQPDAIKDVCESAMSQGCHIVMLGVSPVYDVSGLLRTDFYQTGVVAANMLLKWIHDTYPEAAPNSVPVAVGGYLGSDDGVKRTEGFLDTIEADELAVTNFHTDFMDASDPDETMAFAQDSLTYNPNLRCFLLYEIDGAIATSNYILSRTDLDPSEFCVTSVGQNEAGLQLIDQSVDNLSCMRGTISYGGEQPGVQLTEIATRLLFGEPGPIVIFDEIYTYNVIGFEVG